GSVPDLHVAQVEDRETIVGNKLHEPPGCHWGAPLSVGVLPGEIRAEVLPDRFPARGKWRARRELRFRPPEYCRKSLKVRRLRLHGGYSDGRAWNDMLPPVNRLLRGCGRAATRTANSPARVPLAKAHQPEAQARENVHRRPISRLAA